MWPDRLSSLGDCDLSDGAPHLPQLADVGLGTVELPHVSQNRANVGHHAERFIIKTQNGAEWDTHGHYAQRLGFRPGGRPVLRKA
jgi:hypothetical protein